MRGSRGQRRLVDPRTGRLYRVVRQMRPLGDPPRELQQAKLDNLVLIPASQLPLKEEWQQLANELPDGSTLILLPERPSLQRRTLERVARGLKESGHPVQTVTASELQQYTF